MYNEPFEGFGPILKMARDRAHDPSRVVDINKFRRRKDLLSLQAAGHLDNAIYDYEEDKICLLYTSPSPRD